jgi:hypothetical protein
MFHLKVLMRPGDLQPYRVRDRTIFGRFESSVGLKLPALGFTRRRPGSRPHWEESDAQGVRRPPLGWLGNWDDWARCEPESAPWLGKEGGLHVSPLIEELRPPLCGLIFSRGGGGWGYPRRGERAVVTGFRSS